MNTTSVKVGPIAPIKAIFPEDLDVTGNEFEYQVIATDKDNDKFNVALANGYILNLSKDMNMHDINTDTKDVLDTAFKSRKVTFEGKKVMILDTLFVELMFRGSKISNMILDFLKQYCSEHDIEYILLLAKPIVTYKAGISPVSGMFNNKEMQNIINSLYRKNGFDYLHKTKKIMYYKL